MQSVKMRVMQCIVLWVVLLAFSDFANCERLNEQIYSSIEGSAACFRRLNGTHQAGCSSTQSGAVGVVLMVKEYLDAQWLVHNSSAGPYMAVVSTTLFHDVIELLMASPTNVAGVLIYDNGTERTDRFTQESQCPNQKAAWSESQCPKNGSVWNVGGSDLLRRDIPFPIFFLPKSRKDKELVKIEECHNRYNLDKNNQLGVPLCSVQMSSFMYAAVDTTVCMRRSAGSTFFTPVKVCDPLSDNNVYYSLFPRATDPNKTVTLVTARIDSTSLFDGVAPGAASAAIGMVALITAAATLSKMIPIEDSNKYTHNILWTLFNGEAFDYIGSQRVAYDLSRGAWPYTPLSISDIKLHVDIGQLGGSFADSIVGEWPLHAYAPYKADVPAIVTDFVTQISNYGNVYKVNFTTELTPNLPPSSIHSFRRILKTPIPELVLVDHEETFTNKYYHSVLDDYEAVSFVYHNISISNGTFIGTDELLKDGTMKESDMQVKIARLATALSRTLYQQVTGTPYIGNNSTSAHLVDEMLYCFLRSQACRLLMYADYQSSDHDEVEEKPIPLYVGVAAWASPPPVFAGHLLALLTGSTAAPKDRKGCDALNDPNYSHYWLRGWDLKGVCIQTTMNFSQALSPAFIVQDYDFQSGLYSTWSESVWQGMWARVFVSASGGSARSAAIAGAIATVIAAAATYWLRKHAAALFVNAPTAVVNEQATGILRTVNC